MSRGPAPVASVVLDSQYSRRAWELAVFRRDRDGGAYLHRRL